MPLVRATEDFTLDVQNWRRYGVYVRAGQIVTVSSDEAAAVERLGKGKIVQPVEPTP